MTVDIWSFAWSLLPIVSKFWVVLFLASYLLHWKAPWLDSLNKDNTFTFHMLLRNSFLFSGRNSSGSHDIALSNCFPRYRIFLYPSMKIFTDSRWLKKKKKQLSVKRTVAYIICSIPHKLLCLLPPQGTADSSCDSAEDVAVTTAAQCSVSQSSNPQQHLDFVLSTLLVPPCFSCDKGSGHPEGQEAGPPYFAPLQMFQDPQQPTNPSWLCCWAALIGFRYKKFG